MIIFVTDSFLKLQKADVVRYFNPQIQELLASGQSGFEVIWSPDLPVTDSSESLRLLILRQSKPVVLVGHGKGGVDILDLLVRYPEVRKKVKRFLCVQAPIWGTPLADFLTGQPVVRLISNVVAKILGGDMRALEELSELNRQVYMILHRQEIQKILNEVDVVSLGSSFDWNQKPETWAVRIQQYFYQLIQKYAGANDGLVPILSTRILNEPHVEMKNVTHMGSVTTKSPKELAELISF